MIKKFACVVLVLVSVVSLSAEVTLPALVIAGEVKSSGKIPDETAIVGWLTSAATG